jgi:formamidopyrimidine-DNA glycosylase
MPELPDLEAYRSAIVDRAVGQPLTCLETRGGFLLRTVTPPKEAFEGRTLERVRRIGKRLVFVFSGEHALALHLMRAGRLRWAKPDAGLPGRGGLGALRFASGALLITEAGKKRRASVHLFDALAALSDLDAGGVEPLDVSLEAFTERLQARNQTLKRALTHPAVVAGIGNAYSDEILHAARLSPFKRSHDLADQEVRRLHEAMQEVLRAWRDALVNETGKRFPKATAFRDGMRVHGRYKEPCPVCGDPVQRISFSDSELNYCATCQTHGRVLLDRSLSRLLKNDFPRDLDAWEERIGG